MLVRPLAAGLAFVFGTAGIDASGSGWLGFSPTALAGPNEVSSTGWQRKGTGAAVSRPATPVVRSGSLPRPFDADEPTTVASGNSGAPWAAPVATGTRGRSAPEPELAPPRIRHVAGSAQSPGGPLKWRVRDGDESPERVNFASTVSVSERSAIRPTAHLQDDQDAEPLAVESPEADDASEEAIELNSPQAGSGQLRLVQGPEPAQLDPAVPADRPLPKETPPRAPSPAPRRSTVRGPANDSRDIPPAVPQDDDRDDSAAPRLRPIPRGREADLNLLRDVPCERMYGPDKNRNCCAEELLCGEARRRVKLLTIGRIKLDITPTCNLAGEWSDAPETKCGWQLEASPVRVWKDRVGQQITVGRFSGFANARIVITGEDGKTTKVKLRDLGEDERCFVTAWCGLPFECGLVDAPLMPREWDQLTMTWAASGLCHKPLYFEDAQLERYGHTFGPAVQPFVSGAHFFTNIALLPYNMGIHPMRECQYSLGYYRPGSCAPRMIPPFPLSVRAALLEAGVWVGGIYILP